MVRRRAPALRERRPVRSLEERQHPRRRPQRDDRRPLHGVPVCRSRERASDHGEHPRCDIIRDRRRRERWLQRRALRTLRNVTLVDTPTVTAARCPDSTDDVILTLHTVRPYVCRVAGLSAAQADRLLRQSGRPVEVIFRFVLSVHRKHVAGLAIQRITLGEADKIVLTAGQLEVSPDTGRAYEIYRQGLGLQEQRQFTQALRCFDEALGCDPEAAAIINHVAWFRATTDAEPFRDPPMSLKLALHALDSCRTYGTGYLPDILDTAARACYENGQYAEALQYEQDALRYEPRSHSYRDQLDMISKKLPPSPAAP